MAVFRESSRTRRRRQKKSRRSRSDKSLGAGRVSSKTNRRSNFLRKKTTTIAKTMLATEFGKKQGGIQKIGSAIAEKRFSGEAESSRSWHDLLDPWGLKGYGPRGRGPKPPVYQLGTIDTARAAGRGFAGSKYDTKRALYKSGFKAATIPPTAGSSKLNAFLGIAASLGGGAAALWWIGQSTKGGGDTGTQLVLNFLEDIQYAIYIDNRLISVLDEASFAQFMNNMKRNLQLRTRGLRSD